MAQAKHLPIKVRSPYAPIRYEATRPYATEAGARFMQSINNGVARNDSFFRAMAQRVNDHLMALGRGPAEGHLLAEMTNIQMFGFYQHAGRVIFDVEPLLTEVLKRTGLDEIPCEAIISPCDTFYLHFGHNSGSAAGGGHVEGVFVHHARETQSLTLSLVNSNQFRERQFWRIDGGELPVAFRIPLDNPSMPLKEALETSIVETVKHNKILVQQFRSTGGELIERIPGQITQLDSMSVMLEDVMVLVANAMLYLTARPEDIDMDWQRDAPAEAIKAIGSAKSFSAKLKAERTLLDAGYIKVKHMGNQFARSEEGVNFAEGFSAGRTMPTHYRRGHFRRQAHGEGNLLRKIVLIAPTIINPTMGQAPGRVYDVVEPTRDRPKG